MLYQVCMPCSDSSLKDVTHFPPISTLVAWGSYLGETQMWRSLKCYTTDCISGVFEWLLVLGEHMHHCGLPATVICKLCFSFGCIYLKIYISLECLQEVTELVAGQDFRPHDKDEIYLFHILCRLMMELPGVNSSAWNGWHHCHCDLEKSLFAQQ